MDAELIAKLPFPIFEIGPGHQLPRRLQHTNPHHQNHATFPRSNQPSVGGFHGDNQGPPLRARDPRVQSYSGTSSNQPGYYGNHEITQSCSPTLVRQQEQFTASERSNREAEFENSGYFGPGSDWSSRKVPLARSQSVFPFRYEGPNSSSQVPWTVGSNQQLQERSHSQDDHGAQVYSNYTHHDSRSSTADRVDTHTQAAMRLRNQFSTSTPELYDPSTQYRCPTSFPDDLPDVGTPQNGRVSPHPQTKAPPIPPRAPTGKKPVKRICRSVSPYSNQLLESSHSNDSQPSQIPLDTRDPRYQQSPGHSPVYGNMGQYLLNPSEYAPHSDVLQSREKPYPQETESSSQMWQEPSSYQVRKQHPPNLPPRPSPPPQQPNTYTGSPVPELPPKPSSSSVGTPSQQDTGRYQTTRTSPTLPPKPVTQNPNASQLEDYMPSELSVLDDPNAPPRPPRKVNKLEEDLPEEIASMNIQTDSRKQHTNEQVPFDANLTCPVCEKQFRADQTLKCGAHVKECRRQREERQREWVS